MEDNFATLVILPLGVALIGPASVLRERREIAALYRDLARFTGDFVDRADDER